MKCTMGTSTAKLKATPKNVSLVGKDQANIADFVSMVNVPGFGRCRSLAYPPTAAATAANHGHLTPMPCVPGTCPFWSAVDRNSLVCGQPALLKAATLKCSFGGTISIVSPGQNKEVKAGGSASQQNAKQEIDKKKQQEMLAELEDAPQNGEIPVNFDKDEFLDNVQVFFGILGFIPVAGAIADLANAAISVSRGDWVGAGLNVLSAVPGIGDAAAGAKIAYRVTKVKTTGNILNNTYKAARRIEAKAPISRKYYDAVIDKVQTGHELMNDRLLNGIEEESEGLLTELAAPVNSYDADRSVEPVDVHMAKTEQNIDYEGKEVLKNTKRVLNLEFKQSKEPVASSSDINKSIESSLKGYVSSGMGGIMSLPSSARAIVNISHSATSVILPRAYKEICYDAYPRIIPPLQSQCIAEKECNIQFSIENIDNRMYDAPSGVECPEYGLLVKSFPNTENVKKTDQDLKLNRKGNESAGTQKYCYDQIRGGVTKVPIILHSGKTYCIRAYLCAKDLYGYICSYSDTLVIKMP